jgi:hypothetical protein
LKAGLFYGSIILAKITRESAGGRLL